MDRPQQTEFEKIFNASIKRDGSQKLLDWIRSSDFFEAPASTRFHGSRPGGLVDHSLNVYYRLLNLYKHEYGEDLTEEQQETIAIVSLLHDICKANFYKVEIRNRKNDQGQWEKYPAYVVNDQLPYGHGEKSVYIVSSFMKLTRDESMAIRWHMGGFDDAVKGGSFALNGAFEMFPLAVLTHVADLLATTIDEGPEGLKKVNDSQ